MVLPLSQWKNGTGEGGLGLRENPSCAPWSSLWLFKSVLWPSWDSWGLEMDVVRAEDSGEQPGSYFDVTLGLGFSGFQDSPWGG